MATARCSIIGAAVVAVALFVAGAGSSASTPAGEIVFAAHPTGIGPAQLFRIRSDGQGLAQFTTGEPAATAPDVSRDGRHVVFMRLGAGIFSVNLDGSGQRKLTSGVRDSYPVWSPDGMRIAFLRPHRAQWRVHVMSAAGRNEHRLRQAPPAGRPSWTADGKGMFIPSAGDLVRIDSSSGKVLKYYGATLDIQTAQTATVSPGARTVAFVGPRVSTGPEDCGEGPCPQFGLYLTNVSKPHRTRRIVNDTGPAGWSPDGTHLVFISRGALTLFDLSTRAKTLIPMGSHVPTGDAPPAWGRTR